MTYILGSVCADGVMLVGGKKIVTGDGSSHEFDNKLFMDTPGVVVGSSGVLGLFEKFRQNVMAYTASPTLSA